MSLKINISQKWNENFNKKKFSKMVSNIANLNSFEFIDKIHTISKKIENDPNIILHYYFYYMHYEEDESTLDFTNEMIKYLFFNLCKMYPTSLLLLLKIVPNYILIVDIGRFMVASLTKERDSKTFLLYKKLLNIMVDQINSDYLSILKCIDKMIILSKDNYLIELDISDILNVFSLYNKDDYSNFNMLKIHVAKRLFKGKSISKKIKKLDSIIDMYLNLKKNTNILIKYVNYLSSKEISSLCMKLFHKRFIEDVMNIYKIDKNNEFKIVGSNKKNDSTFNYAVIHTDNVYDY